LFGLFEQALDFFTQPVLCARGSSRGKGQPRSLQTEPLKHNIHLLRDETRSFGSAEV